MVYRKMTSALVEQWWADVRAVQELLVDLWLDGSPDIEEDIAVPPSPYQKAMSSRGLALQVTERISELLQLFTDEQAASEAWVAEHQLDVQRKVRRFENVFVKGRFLYEVSP